MTETWYNPLLKSRRSAEKAVTIKYRWKQRGNRRWYVKLLKTAEGYYVEYDTEDGAGDTHIYKLKSSAMRRFNNECKPLARTLITVTRGK